MSRWGRRPPRQAHPPAPARPPGPGFEGGGGARLRGICRSFPGFELGPVDLDVSPGSIHGLLGPNGSGKTTVLELLCGLRPPTSGALTVEGRPPDPDDAARYRRLGYAPDGGDSLPAELTAAELWDLCARLHARITGDAAAMVRRASWLADRLRFDPPPRPISEYSHGMRRKTLLVAALLHDPPLIVLDEPTNGLDPVAGHELGVLLRGFAQRGSAVLVATHDLVWTMRFAHEVSVLTLGRVVAAGPPTAVFPDADTRGVGALLDQFVAAVAG